MKNFAFVLIAFCLLGSSQKQPAQLDQLSWLLGSWASTRNSDQKQSYEIWTKVSDTKYAGFGYALKNGDTTFSEKLEILEHDGQLFYVADVSHNTDPIFFKMDFVSDTLFSCTNPFHDFPQNIAYRRDGNNLYAQIWNKKDRIDYSFVKVD